MKKVLLGFDPGGIATFGWAAAEYEAHLPLRVFAHGATGDGQTAVDHALDAVPIAAEVIAAGIDAPLCWGPSGGRRADQWVRNAIACAGCPTPGGTVQHVNSLRGACLVQGLLALRRLRQRISAIVVSESHPKALLWLLGVANSTLPVVEVAADHLPQLRFEDPAINSHTRDAALGVLSAWAAITTPEDWTDLVAQEPEVFFPCGPVGYYMPDQGKKLGAM